jgi:hypothetical protein
MLKNALSIEVFTAIATTRLIHKEWAERAARLSICGRVVRWSVGALERWSVGALERWSVGALERWSVGALERWSVGWEADLLPLDLPIARRM